MGDMNYNKYISQQPEMLFIDVRMSEFTEITFDLEKPSLSWTFLSNCKQKPLIKARCSLKS